MLLPLMKNAFLPLAFVFSSCVWQAPAAMAQAQPSADVAGQTARTVPAWVRSGVVYQVWPRAFSAEGTLNGVTARLDELQKLDVNILWLMPIHPVGRLKSKGSLGSPYAVRDYYAVDPALGTKEDLKRLVTEAHRRGMKVILDIVANHTAWDSVMMAHPEFYRKGPDGKPTYPYDWTDVAALDYTNPALRQYMSDMLLYWIKDFDVDGYRCDAAGEVPTTFWKDAAARLRNAKPEIVMLAEAEKPDLMVSAFDIDYAWAGMHSLNDVLMNGAPAQATTQGTLESQRKRFPKGTLHMRMTDDHDELRAIARYGYPGAIAAWTVAATLEGVPLIWNGMEVGDTTSSAAPALFEPQKINWQAVNWHREYPAYFTTLDHLRREHTAFQTGDAQWVHNSDEQHVVSYTRTDGKESFLVEVNLSNAPFRGTVDGEKNGWTEVKLPGFSGGSGSLTANATDAEKAPSTAALAAPALPAFGVRIFSKAGGASAGTSPTAGAR